MLRLDGVTCDLGGFRLSADLDVPEGARVAVLGASGDGKSTLLSLIAGFLAPDTGRVLWQERDLTGQWPAERPVAMLFQDNNLFPHLTVRRNLALALTRRLRIGADQAARIDEGLARVSLSGLAERKPAALSGGQMSRVAVARVLLQARPIWLLDEPFAALGPALKREMLDLVVQEAGRAGATVLMVTHDPEDARRFAETAIVVADGRAEPPVLVDRLLNDPPAALRRYLGA